MAILVIFGFVLCVRIAIQNCKVLPLKMAELWQLF